MPKAPLLFFSAADSRSDLRERLARRSPSTVGAFRIAIVAPDAERLSKLVASAMDMLAAGRSPRGPGIHYGDRPLEGEVAFVYPELGASYGGLYQALLKAFPEIVEERLESENGWTSDLAAALAAYADPSVPLADARTPCSPPP